MLVATGTPYEIPRYHFTFVIHDAAFEHIGLLDLYMLMQRQTGTRRPAKQRREQPTLLVLHEYLHVDTRGRSGFPRKRLNTDIARSKL
ncbi:hypothetical protein D3C84_1140950 [compost metagenome]